MTEMRKYLLVMASLILLWSGAGGAHAQDTQTGVAPAPLTALRQQQEAARNQDLEKIEAVRRTIAELDAGIDQSPKGLDLMMEILRQRKILKRMQEQFEKDEAERKVQYDRLYDQQKAKDIEKYQQIIASPDGQDYKEAARKALVTRYPELRRQMAEGDKTLHPAPDDFIRMTNTLDMEFVFLPPGRFLMGSPEDEVARDADELQHAVEISTGFFIQVTEVTQGQWQAVMKHNPAYFESCGKKCPVESVSHDEAMEFVKRLNQLEQTTKYSLPTEAQWEYAARAGTRTSLSNGPLKMFGCGLTPSLDDISWYCGNSERQTHPVRKRKPNPWGLFDIHGNVWEWCADWYGPYPKTPVIDPGGPAEGQKRVLRGGSWLHNPSHMRSANRFFGNPGYKSRAIGLRLVKQP